MTDHEKLVSIIDETLFILGKILDRENTNDDNNTNEGGDLNAE